MNPGQSIVRYDVDPSIIRVLQSVFQEVAVRRPVSEAQKQDLVAALQQRGILVTLYDGPNKIKSFYTGGDENKRYSYFMEEGSNQPYIVHLPGYNSYVSGIFEIPENDWRNRAVVQSNFRLIRSVQIDYPAAPVKNFRIQSTRDFFEVRDVSEVDTTSMMEYLANFEFFQVDNFIDITEKGYVQFDSLSKTQPWMTIEIDAVSGTPVERLTFFNRVSGDNRLLGKLDENQYVLYDCRRIRPLFKSREDFLQK